MFTFFFREQSPFSQWHRVKMQENGIEFNCCEQYMMYQKAKLFKDDETADEILRANHPREHKSLGRKVKNFDAKVWDLNKEKIVYQGNLLKFTQHPNLKQQLLDTGDTILVEASPFDRIWGIGLAADDPRASKPSQWRGQNKLGNILTLLRNSLAK